MATENDNSRYNPAVIEPKWQKFWLENKTFKTEVDHSKPKYYILDMFPYPSGAGLHIGHPEGYTATDILARYKRMNGFNVLHPMGWDAYGLPAEQHAIQTGTHPAVKTKENCDTFKRQIQMLGFSYDWDREIATCEPKYYKWTQWIFIRLYNTWFDEKLQKGRPISELPIPSEIKAKGDAAVCEYINSKRLAYYDDAKVWWCNKCKIVCANEEVLNDGSHEKCGSREVERRNLKQWLLRIPLYAERLLAGLDTVDWPEGIKDQQRNWIGRSTGAEVDFQIVGLDEKLRVYTTRPDTLFGATYMVIAPEHPLVKSITTKEQEQAVNEYIKAASLKSDLDRTDLAKDKTGVFSGAYAINPLNGTHIPIWIADYVLIGYGTGAIMAVPAHDTRDFEFAKKFNLPIICILDPEQADEKTRELVLKGDACWTEDGAYINSANAERGININGLNKDQGIRTIIDWLCAHNLGTAAVNYKLRDWLFSRQRYWGEPFPIIHWEDGSVSLVDDKDLPLELPSLQKYQPGENGESPLANATEWLQVVDANGRKGRRETNTMPQWAGSCWYYLRYLDANNENQIFDPQKEKYWMPVDLYVGGAEHAVLHLLYSRFWHKVLYDLGIVSTDEPFQKLFNQGMILAYAYENSSGSKIPVDEVEEKNGKFFLKETGEEVKQIIAKMSKSLKNVINPDDVVAEYGTDTLRLYEMFMGPLEQVKPWNPQSIGGVHKFLNRSWNLIVESDNKLSSRLVKDDVIAYGSSPIEKAAHRTIKKVTEDLDGMRFHTAIATLMGFLNNAYEAKQIPTRIAKDFVLMLAPFGPHLAEELWSRLGEKQTLTYQAWPKFDPELVRENSVTIAVQINGKLRETLEVDTNISKEDLLALAKEAPKVKGYLTGKTIKKEIVVPKRLVNLVVGE